MSCTGVRSRYASQPSGSRLEGGTILGLDHRKHRKPRWPARSRADEITVLRRVRYVDGLPPPELILFPTPERLDRVEDMLVDSARREQRQFLSRDLEDTAASSVHQSHDHLEDPRPQPLRLDGS